MSNVSPVFEDFLTIFQHSCPQVHLLYHKMSEFLPKLMDRFLKRDAYEKFVSDLVSIDCSAKSQLPDAATAIGEGFSLAHISQIVESLYILASADFIAHPLISTVSSPSSEHSFKSIRMSQSC